jgi:hypothetical protein
VPLLALDYPQGLAGEHEEVLLIGFPVVHAHRLTRREHIETDSDLPEVRLAIEDQTRPPPLVVEPAGLSRAEDEPSLPGGHQPTLCLFERGLGNHRRILDPPGARSG